MQMFDGYGTETRSEFDELSRQVKQTQAFGLPIALVSESEYDVDGDMVKTIDPAGTETTYIYDSPGNMISGTQASGTSIAMTTAYEYDIDGQQIKVTSPGGAISQSFRADCCGNSRGSRNALGNGSISNANVNGQVVHTAVVESYDSHTDLLNPIDGQTLGEQTTQYFDNGRTRFRTVWKSARGTIDHSNPPIAGIGGVALAGGVTTQQAYDNSLVDGVGLDSAAGLQVSTLGGGTANISIASAITKLAETIANGGAGVTFDATSSGSASVSISPDEKMLQVSISDAIGQGVMTCSMTGPASSTPNQLINWSCIVPNELDSTSLSFAVLKSSSVDPDGETVARLVNGYGQAISSIDQLGNASTSEFDSAGNLLKSTNALTHSTTYTYDELSRQLTVKDALNNTRSTVFEPTTGRVASQTDAKANISSSIYDELGRVKNSTDRTGKITHRTYDSAGRLETIKDAENRTTTDTYDLLGRRTITTLADLSAKAMTYDAAGRITKVDLASGKSQTTTYEFSGVADKVEYRDATDTLTGTDDFSYDALLRRNGSLSRYNVARVLSYNDQGQLATDTTNYGGQSYVVTNAYDDRGRLEKLTYPSGREVTYGFDQRTMLDTIDVDGIEIEDRSYDAIGRLTNVDRAHVDEVRTYDVVNRVIGIANTNVGNAMYGYDANGNKLSEMWTGVMAAWNFTTQDGSSDGYDDEDRFLNFIQAGQVKVVNMTRSDIGNISNVNLNGTGIARAYSSIHELTSIGGTAQTFDGDGNLTVAQSGVDLAWDEAGMLKQSLVSAGDTAGIEGTNEYGYDASQKRVTKKITRSGTVAEDTVYVYAGPNVVAEYTKGSVASAPNQEYIYGESIDSLVMIVRSGGTQKLNVTRNQQWSVSALTDHSNGTVLERYTYDEFGKRTILAADGMTVRATSNYDNPYGYTSRRHDEESGLMYFRARYYEPTTGEFCSKDPLEYVDGMSLYRGYFVPSSIDFSGMTTMSTASDKYCRKFCKPYHEGNPGQMTRCIGWCKGNKKQEIFDHWVELDELEVGSFWETSLGDHKCPQKLCSTRSAGENIVTYGLENPDPKKWESPGKIGYHEGRYHPKACYSMRSVAVDGHSNQCTYDCSGNLITTGLGHGTVDFGAPAFPYPGAHIGHDVNPVVYAAILDGCWDTSGMFGRIKPDCTGPNLEKYLKRRPLWASDEPTDCDCDFRTPGRYWGDTIPIT